MTWRLYLDPQIAGYEQVTEYPCCFPNQPYFLNVDIFDQGCKVILTLLLYVLKKDFLLSQISHQKI